MESGMCGCECVQHMLLYAKLKIIAYWADESERRAGVQAYETATILEPLKLNDTFYTVDVRYHFLVSTFLSLSLASFCFMAKVFTCGIQYFLPVFEFASFFYSLPSHAAYIT